VPVLGDEHVVRIRVHMLREEGIEGDGCLAVDHLAGTEVLEPALGALHGVHATVLPILALDDGELGTGDAKVTALTVADALIDGDITEEVAGIGGPALRDALEADRTGGGTHRDDAGSTLRRAGEADDTM